MSKIEKKDIIHIAVEIVVFIAITFYFSRKNKQIFKHLSDLSKKLEEQEEIIQNHEKIMTELIKYINNQNTQINISPSFKRKKNIVPIKKQNQAKKTITENKNSKVKVSLKETNELVNKTPLNDDNKNTNDSDSESDSELDKEIEVELQDLNDNIPDLEYVQES